MNAKLENCFFPALIAVGCLTYNLFGICIELISASSEMIIIRNPKRSPQVTIPTNLPIPLKLLFLLCLHCIFCILQGYYLIASIMGNDSVFHNHKGISLLQFPSLLDMFFFFFRTLCIPFTCKSYRCQSFVKNSLSCMSRSNNGRKQHKCLVELIQMPESGNKNIFSLHVICEIGIVYTSLFRSFKSN